MLFSKLPNLHTIGPFRKTLEPEDFKIAERTPLFLDPVKRKKVLTMCIVYHENTARSF